MPITARVVLLAVAVAVASCARNPVTGKRQLALISEDQEIALGKQSAEQVMQTLPPYPDPRLQEYVAGIGKRIAAKSERPNIPWSFTVLDDPTVNAFALPGGPVFITRGILTHMNSEAELASVLGHEIGHITARHSVDQLSKAQLAQLGLGVGMIFSENLRKFGGVAGAGLQLMFLKFGRDDERQSDKLGFEYMVEQGYDPREMANVFRTLERASSREGGGRIPEWASTHPDPGNRAETAAERAARVKNLAQLAARREEFLAHVGGMVFGDDPRQGFFKGNAFLHPQMRFQLQLPQGWKAQNMPAALVAVGPNQDAAIQLTLAGKGVSPEDATRKFFAQEGVRAAGTEVGKVSGLPAAASYFEAQTQEGVLRGIVSFISHEGSTFQIVGYTPAERFGTHDDAFKKVIQSFGPLTDPAALAVQPARVELVKVPRDMTVAEFNAQFPSNAPADIVAIVNGVGKDGQLRAGQTAKRIVGGPPGGAVPKS